MRYARSSQGHEAVLMLLKHGADVNAMTDGRNDFRTVLHYAILSGKNDVLSRTDYPVTISHNLLTEFVK